ncbi:hypothetical protein LCGC14_2688560, partial [marine sediment metagenome]
MNKLGQQVFYLNFTAEIKNPIVSN